MLHVTRFNDSRFVINSDLIQTMEETPDTVITLTTGTKYVVKESCQELVVRIVEYKRRVYSGVLNTKDK